MEKSDFIEIWFNLRRTPCPSFNFRNGNKTAKSYVVECDLDHIDSRVSRLGTSYIEGIKWDYAKLAKQEILELEDMVSIIEKEDISIEDKEGFLQYIDISRKILQALIITNT